MPSFLAMLVLDAAYQKSRFRCGILLYLSLVIMGSIPGARAEIGEYASGLVLHSLAYATVTFLLYTGSNGTALRRTIQSVLIVAVLGALDELVQSFFPYRHGAVGDWLVDCAAALLAAVVLSACLPKPVKH